MSLLVEALVVGLSAAIVGFLLSVIVMYATEKDFTIKKYTFWKSSLFTFFLAGVILHLLFEKLGANNWYCKHGNACSP